MIQAYCLHGHGGKAKRLDNKPLFEKSESDGLCWQGYASMPELKVTKWEVAKDGPSIVRSEDYTGSDVCPNCRGTGKITLLHSVVDCDCRRQHDH